MTDKRLSEIKKVSDLQPNEFEELLEYVRRLNLVAERLGNTVLTADSELMAIVSGRRR